MCGQLLLLFTTVLLTLCLNHLVPAMIFWSKVFFLSIWGLPLSSRKKEYSFPPLSPLSTLPQPAAGHAWDGREPVPFSPPLQQNTNMARCCFHGPRMPHRSISFPPQQQQGSLPKFVLCNYPNWLSSSGVWGEDVHGHHSTFLISW